MFLQQLIHAGFDCKNGKYLSTIENSFIVSKAKDFNLDERLENGYQWTEKHQNRSPIDLNNSTIDNSKAMLYNCNHVLPGGVIKSPETFYGMTISMPRWNFQCTI